MTNAKSHWLGGVPHFGCRSTLLVACVTIAASYLVPHLVGTMTSNPETVWPLWPGSAILVTGLLLVRADVWPLVIPASFVGFAVADFQAGVPLSSIARFIPGNTLEVLISAVGLRYCFDGVPKLNSVRAFVKYSFFAIILGPLAGAFFSAHGVTRDYWTGWKIVFLSEALAFITVTPALLSWISEGRALMRRSRAYHIEGMALIVGLILVSYIVFTVREDSRSPALFYTLVPFLLWSALRFGWLGVSTSLIAVTSLSIWGAVYGRGPFSNMVPLTDPLPLQMFLVFASIPFMVLAALAEEHEHAVHVVRESEERLRLAQSAAHVGTFDLNLRTGVDTWTPETEALFGLRPGGFGGTLSAFEDLIHPDDRERIRELIQEMIRTRQDPNEDAEYRVVWPDGSVHWIAGRGRLVRDESDELSRMIGVNMDVTQRKRAEEALLSSEQRYRLLFERNVAGVGIGSLDGRVLDCNDGWARILGYESRGEILGRHASEFYFNPQERQLLVEELRDKQQVFSRELQLKRKDGSPVWVLFNAAALNAEHNAPMLQTTMIDISEWKRSELALADMTRKLIEAQEQERARIGRELHDDINQRLAMLSLELEQLQENPSEIQFRVKELRRQTAELSNDVQALSHDLHSSKLEYLGVVAGMKSWCKEFAERHKMEIDFRSDVPGAVPLQVGLPLFRVIQEALQNVIKHSGVRWVEVELREDESEIHLLISDSGQGFNVDAALQGKGLGLTSMRERIRLVNGTIAIESRPMTGTRIQVRVPLQSKQEARRVAG